jgi:hypothetical protein
MSVRLKEEVTPVAATPAGYGEIYFDIADSLFKQRVGGVINVVTNPTDAEIKTAYENNADTNAFTDAEKTLLGNQSGTNTGDMSDAQVKTAYENNADTNTFTDAEKTLLGNQSGTNTGDQTTVSGKSGSTDALETTGATVDVSASAPPTAGQVLIASTATAAEWQDFAGGGSEIEKSEAGNTFVVGTAIYHDGLNWQFAKADNADTLAEFVVTEIIVAGTSFKAAKFGQVTSVGHGFTPSEHYYLSDVSNIGGAVIAEPSTFSCPLFYVEDANTLQLEVYRPAVVNAGGAFDAMALQTTGASVDVSASAPPTTGEVLIATSPTTATWQAAAAGVTMTDWVDNGAINLLGSTTAPTKGATSRDKIYSRRVGDSLEMRFEFHQTSAGTAGSGSYIIVLPSGLSMDGAKINTTSASPSTVISSHVGTGNIGNALNEGSAVNQEVEIAVWSSNALRVLFEDNTYNNRKDWANNALGLDNTTIHFSGMATVPISGWTTSN